MMELTFLQGPDAAEALEILLPTGSLATKETAEACLAYLQTMAADEPAWAGFDVPPGDMVLEMGYGYYITYNVNLGYIGLYNIEEE